MPNGNLYDGPALTHDENLYAATSLRIKARTGIGSARWVVPVLLKTPHESLHLDHAAIGRRPGKT